MTRAVHSSVSSEWYTPPAIVAAAREVLGRIDLDPASCQEANAVVGATRFLSASGLTTAWAGRVWLNPPSPPAEWWKKLVQSYLEGTVRAAVFLAYSIEQLQQSQAWTPDVPMLSGHVCIPRQRVRFLCRAADLAEKRRARLVKLLSAAERDAKEIARLERVLVALQSGDPRRLVVGDSPTHGSAVIGLGVSGEAFVRAFGALGACTTSFPRRPAKAVA